MEPATARVVLMLKLTADGRVEGHLERDGAGDRPFSGWLELMAALEEVFEKEPRGSV